MADNKEIRISASLDTTKFDAGIKALEDKTKNLQKALSQGANTASTLKDSPVFGPSAAKVYEELNKTTKESFQNMHKGQEIAYKNGQNFINSLKEQIKLEKEKTNLNKEQIKNSENALRFEEYAQRSRLSLAASIRNSAPAGTFDTKGNPMGSALVPNYNRGWTYGNQGGGNGGGGGMIPYSGGAGYRNNGEGEGSEEEQGLTKTIKAAAGVAILKGALNSTVKYLEHRIDRDSKVLTDRASAATVAAQGLHETIAGKGYEQAFWAKERSESFDIAKERQAGIKNKDAIAGAGSVAIAALMGGFAAGPLGALAGGTLAMRANSRNYNLAFDSEAYNAMASKEAMQNYQGNVAAREGLDPWKKIASEQYASRYGGYIKTARSMGLSTEELFGKNGVEATPATSGKLDVSKNWALPTWIPGKDATAGKEGTNGYLQQGLNQFSPETMARQAEGIAGAGSSTNMMANGRVISATYERQFGLSNAGSLFGQLGAMGIDKDASQDMRKTLEAAITAGFNKSDLSKMPQELQRFAQAVMEVATSHGGFSGKTAEQFGAALNGQNISPYSIAEAKSAVENYNKNASDVTGLHGQMGYTAVSKQFPGMKDPLQQRSTNAMTSAFYDSLDESVKLGLALEAGFTGPTATADFGKRLGLKDAAKQYALPEQSAANQAYHKMILDYPGISQKDNKYSAGIKESFSRAQAKVLTIETALHPNQKSPTQIFEEANISAAQANGEAPRDWTKEISNQLNKTTDKNAAAHEKMLGTGASTEINDLKKFIPELTKASQAFNSNAVHFLASFDTVKTALLNGATGLDEFAASLEKVQKALGKTPASTQAKDQPQKASSSTSNTKKG